MLIKERVEQALVSAGLPTSLIVPTPSASKFVFNKPDFTWTQLYAPKDWCIKIEDVVGEGKFAWYRPLLANSWPGQCSTSLIINWFDSAEPENAEFLKELEEHERGSRLAVYKSKPALNLDGLGMRFCDKEVCLWQCHKPFVKHVSWGWNRPGKVVIDKDYWLDWIVVTIRNLRRLRDFADKPLTDVNMAIKGFNAQIRKIKTKNSLVNEKIRKK